LRVLRNHGMGDSALQIIYRAVVVAILLYAASEWWGVTTAADRQRVEAVLRRGVRACLYEAERPTIAQLDESNDDTLLCRVISCSSHLLHKLLPDRTSHGYQLSLKRRPHDRILAASDDTRNFIHRLLHRNVY